MAVLHVKLDDVAVGGAELGLQVLEAVATTTGRNHLATSGDIAARGGGAKAGGGAGDEDDKALGIEQLVHGNVLKVQSGLGLAWTGLRWSVKALPVATGYR